MNRVNDCNKRRDLHMKYNTEFKKNFINKFRKDLYHITQTRSFCTWRTEYMGSITADAA